MNRRIVCRSCRLRPELPRCRRCQACPGERRQRQVWMDQRLGRSSVDLEIGEMFINFG